MKNNKVIISSLVAAALLSAFFAGLALMFVFLYNTRTIIIFISITYVIDMCFGLFILNSRYRSQITKSCWLFCIVLLPFLGVILFLTFGTIPFYIKNRSSNDKEWKKLISHEKYDFTEKYIGGEKKYEAFKFNFNNNKSPVYKENDVTKIITNNSNILKNFLHLINKAEKSIFIQTYSIKDGVFFFTIAKALIEKVKAGVKVIFVYDWFGSNHQINYSVIRKMQKAGVEVVVFNPKGRIPYKSLSNFRNHQKCLIVDNESCLYGSANICDEHIRVNRTKIMYTDTMYIVKGEIVNSLSINFLDSYVNFSSAKKHKVNKIMKSLNSLLVFPKNESEKKMAMQLMSGVPNTSINTIPNSIMLSITEARKSIKIISPFFSPTQEIINALLVAALRGVKIQIVLPSKNDEIIFSLSLNRFAYSGLINYDNIKIYEHHSFIHTKLLIVDDEYCVFGSANLDYRSLMINFENSIICNDKHLAKELNEIYDGILDESKNITKEFVKKNALKNKTLNIFLSIYKPLI